MFGQGRLQRLAAWRQATTSNLVLGRLNPAHHGPHPITARGLIRDRYPGSIGYFPEN